MEQRKKNNLTDLLMIHGAVLLFGLAGVISKGITTGSMMITFGRVFFSSITLYILYTLQGYKNLNKAQK